MKRFAFKMKLKPGFAEEYKKRHDEIWPELKELIKVREFQIMPFFLMRKPIPFWCSENQWRIGLTGSGEQSGCTEMVEVHVGYHGDKQ
jgi:hypothetical protein